MTKKTKSLLPILLIVIFFIVISFYIPKEAIERIVVRAGIFAPLVFIFLHFLTQIFAPLSGSPTMALGFFLFGKIAVIYLFLSFVLSTITNFWISRTWGIGIVTKLVGKENLNKLDRFSKQHGYKTLFIIRIFLYGFEDLISYAAGLTSMKFISYLFTSILALIPWTLFWYFFAEKFQLSTTQFASANIGISFFFLSFYTLWEKYFHKHKI